MKDNTEMKNMMEEAEHVNAILNGIISDLERRERAHAESIALDEKAHRQTSHDEIIHRNSLYRVLLMLDECRENNMKLTKAMRALSDSAYCQPDTARDIPW